MEKEGVLDNLSNEERERVVCSKIDSLILSRNYGELYEYLVGLKSGVWPKLSSFKYSKLLRYAFNAIDGEPEHYQEIKGLLERLIGEEERRLVVLDLRCKLVGIELKFGKYKECIDLAEELMPTLKLHDDKVNLINLHLCVSKAHYQLNSLPHAKASLTAAKSLSVMFAAPQYLQAEIDLLNGMYLIDEKYYDTAMNYFVEVIHNNSKSPEALRYIVLARLLGTEDISDESIDGLVSDFQKNKGYKGNVEGDRIFPVLRDLALACSTKDSGKYEVILRGNEQVLRTDQFLFKHLVEYWESLFESAIIHEISFYSEIGLDDFAAFLRVSRDVLENKVRTLVLDKKLNAILDQATQSIKVVEVKTKRDPLKRTIEITNKILNGK